MPVIPETMLYMAHGDGGPPEVLHAARASVPRPGPDEVMLRVAAAGVNRPEVAQRQGTYPPPPGVNPVLGLEAAGEVVAAGSAVTRWAVGDRVCALCNGGAYAEYVTAPATQCLPWPNGYDAVQAAALPENFFTVWANVFERGALRARDTLLVHGGTSGIGITAIRLARAFGARVIATAGSEAKCAAALRLGANCAIDYRAHDFVTEVGRLTDGRGVDVVLDMVAGPYVARNVEALADDGRLVVIAVQGGAIAEGIDMRRIMGKRLVVTGSTLRPRTAEEKGALADALRAMVWPLLDAGTVAAPEIFTVFPLHEAAAAHRLMEGGTHVGKIVLRL